MSANSIFITMHVLAVLFGFIFLVITVPAHLIYLAIKDNK